MNVTTLTCEETEELLPAYMLGALDPAEMATVARHARGCLQHVDSLAAYEAVGDGLAASVPLIDPPAHLRARLLAGLGTRPAATRRAGRRERRVGWGWAAAALATVAAVVLGVWALSMRAQIDSQLALRQQFLDLARQPDAHMVALQADSGSSAKGVLIYASDRAAIWAVALPPLQSDQVFECWWLGSNQERVSGGSFRSAEGVGIWFVSMPEGAEDFHTIGITIEPDSGVSDPQGPRILAGEF